MNRLREIRNTRHETQQSVADAIGVNRATYANYESQRREVDHATLVNLADHFGVSIDYILCRNENEPIVDDDGLRAQAIERVQTLSDPALQRVMDFLDGLSAGQEIEAAAAAERDPASQSDV